jgi:lipopolysaccharide biosynthesis protein
MQTPATKIIALHLPQYHPFPENDAWWGKGFTEWRNVVTSQKRFNGHHQPQIPADLGFYDLRCRETRLQQAEMAKEHGLDAFCYYHYWFNGKLLMEAPLEGILADVAPDFPFLMCWANETWSRAWDGLDHEVLIKQEYSEEDHKSHFEYLRRFFSDPRYFRIQEKPVFVIYRPDQIPNVEGMLAMWRAAAVEHGLGGMIFVGVRSGITRWGVEEILSHSFDYVLDFKPNRSNFPANSIGGLGYKIARGLLPDKLYQYLKRNVDAINMVDYAAMVRKVVAGYDGMNERVFPTVFPSWDNSARRRSSTVIQNDDPEAFLDWLNSACTALGNRPQSDRLIFINAWNEWAEGCHLEPDLVNGRRFLEAVSMFKSRTEK